MSTLNHCTKKTKDYVNKILISNSVHNFTKEIIKKALTKDYLDAKYDIELALKAIDKIVDDIHYNLGD